MAKTLRARGWIGIAVGLVGLVILLSPGWGQSTGGRKVLFASVILILAGFAWSCGSVLSRRSNLATSAFVAAAWEMVFGGIFNSGLLLVSGEAHHVHWTAQGFWSIAWLVVFGSLVGYTAFVYLLDNVPVAKVSTYAYINPIVAVMPRRNLPEGTTSLSRVRRHGRDSAGCVSGHKLENGRGKFGRALTGD